jgi:hypothetical protein
MNKKFSDLRAKMFPQANAKASATLFEKPLHELRRARGKSQRVLAETLSVNSLRWPN